MAGGYRVGLPVAFRAEADGESAALERHVDIQEAVSKDYHGRTCKLCHYYVEDEFSKLRLALKRGYNFRIRPGCDLAGCVQEA